MEAELPSADGDDRRITEDAAHAGSVLTRNALEVSTNNEAGRKVSLRWKSIRFREAWELRKLLP